MNKIAKKIMSALAITTACVSISAVTFSNEAWGHRGNGKTGSVKYNQDGSVSADTTRLDFCGTVNLSINKAGRNTVFTHSVPHFCKTSSNEARILNKTVHSVVYDSELSASVLFGACLRVMGRHDSIGQFQIKQLGFEYEIPLADLYWQSSTVASGLEKKPGRLQVFSDKGGTSIEHPLNRIINKCSVRMYVNFERGTQIVHDGSIFLVYNGKN